MPGATPSTMSQAIGAAVGPVQARPGALAAAHSHSLHGKAFCGPGMPLGPTTQDACARFEDHGLLTAGRSVAEAVRWFIPMKRSCQAQLPAMAAGFA